MNLKPIRGVLFDLDGVIIDSEQLHGQAWEAVAQKHKIPELTHDNYADAHFGASDYDIAALFFAQAEVPERVTEKISYYLENLPNLPISKAIHTFITQRPKSIESIGVVTNCSRREGEHLLATIGLLPYIDFLVTSSDVDHPKPQPDPYAKGLVLTQERCLDIQIDQVLVIEDSVVGATAAQHAGIPNIIQKPFRDSFIDTTLEALSKR